MLPPAAVARLARRARTAFPVMADPPDIAPRLIGEEDVRAEVDPLGRALEPAANAGERIKVHGRVKDDKNIGILRHRLVGRERADQCDPTNARNRSGRPHEREHGL